MKRGAFATTLLDRIVLLLLASMVLDAPSPHRFVRVAARPGSARGAGCSLT